MAISTMQHETGYATKRALAGQERYTPDFLNFVTYLLTIPNLMANADKHSTAKTATAIGVATGGAAAVNHYSDSSHNIAEDLGIQTTLDQGADIYDTYTQWHTAHSNYAPHMTTAAKAAVSASNTASISNPGTIKTILGAAAVGIPQILSGCISDDDKDNDDGNKTTTNIKEPGNYLIRKSNELFGWDSESEEKVNKWLDEVIEETAGAPAYPVESLPYTENSHVDPSGIITPAPTQEIEREYDKALDLNMQIMNTMIHHQGGGDIVDENTESIIKRMIDEKSLDFLQKFKEDNINIVHYGIPEAYVSEDGSKYLTNIFETEDGKQGHIRLKVVNKGDEENPNWMPDRILDYQIYPDNIPLSIDVADFVTPDGDCTMLKKSTEHWGWTQMFPEEDDYHLEKRNPDICTGIISNGDGTLYKVAVFNEPFLRKNQICGYATTRTEDLDELKKITVENSKMQRPSVLWTMRGTEKGYQCFPLCKDIYYQIRDISPRTDSIQRGNPDKSAISGVRKVKETE